jgi:hypothetical protein
VRTLAQVCTVLSFIINKNMSLLENILLARRRKLPRLLIFVNKLDNF